MMVNLHSLVVGSFLTLLGSCAAHKVVQQRGAASGDGFVALPIKAIKNAAPMMKRQESIPLPNVFAGYEYVVNITIGSDNQTVPLNFDTGSSILWVNPDCTKAPEYARKDCFSQARYHPLSSKTSKIQNEAMKLMYGSGAVVGVYYKDDIRLGSTTVKDQQFGVAVDMDEDFGHLGIMGAQFTTKRNHTTFMRSLVDQGQIGSASFSIDLRPVNETGSVVLSGIDTKKYKCKLEKVASSGFGVYLTGFGLSGKAYPPEVWNPKNESKGIYSWIDTGTPSNLLPNKLVQAVAKDYPGAVQHMVDGTPYWSIPCDAPVGTMDFSFGETTIKVSYSDLVIREPKGNCSLSLALTPSDGSVPMILGSPFLRGAYVVMDQERDNVWLGESANCGSNILPITKGEGGVPVVDGCACEPEPSSTRYAAPVATYTRTV